MEYRIINENEYMSVIKNLRRNFYTDSPLHQAIQFTKDGLSQDENEEYYLESLRQGISIGAFKNGELVGAVISTIWKPGDLPKAMLKIKNSQKNLKTKNIKLMIFEKSDELDLFNKYNVNEIFENSILSIDKEFRGQNIGHELISRSLELAKEKGYKIFKADATSFYTQKICTKLGMVTLSETKFKEYLDPETGLPIFNVQPPHDSLKIMLIELQINNLKCKL